MHFAETLLAWTQCALLAPLAILGLHRGWMVWLYARTRRSVEAPPAPKVWPPVTIQLPVFNERDVAVRLIQCVAEMDYPSDKLQIQVLDDSTDDTSDRIREAVAALPPHIDCVQIQRTNRVGFKAGALEEGLATAKGEFVAVFDADFMPPTDFLRRTVPHLVADPKVGMTQARWGHLNPDFSVLTDVQRTLLDGHFIVEHQARARSGCFFNFNGTAGIFRRACIDDAGGWQHDTLTEDMDLSYRAQLRGWKFVYLPELVCPAELPIEMSAFLSQQHRWAKGSVQVARKLLGRILRAPIGVIAKGEAIFHLLGNVAFPLLLGLILVALPLQILRAANGTTAPNFLEIIEAMPLMFATVCLFIYYGLARVGSASWRPSTILRLPLVFAIGAGMCINNTAAVLQAFGKHAGEFLRTPKRDVTGRSRPARPASYRSRRGVMPWLECGLALWASATSLTALWLGVLPTAIFHGLFAIGLGWAGIRSMLEDRRPPATPEPNTESMLPATQHS